MTSSAYASPMALQGLLAAKTAARGAEDLERVRHAALDGGDEERLLGAEEAKQVRLRDAGGGRDLLGRRAVQAVARERPGSGLSTASRRSGAVWRGDVCSSQ